MAHGKPDWGLVAGREIVFGMDDLGELAVRLGSIVSFDRRGNVVFLEDFEATLNKWASFTMVAGSAVGIDTASALSGAQSLKLTTAASAIALAGVYREEFPLASTSIGLEWAHASSDTDIIMRGSLIWRTGAVAYEALIQHNRATNTLQYLDENRNLQTLDANLQLFNSDLAYHRVKLVIDVLAGKYQRLLVDTRAYDMSAIPLNVQADNELPRATMSLCLLNTTANARNLWLDCVILTQEEPT